MENTLVSEPSTESVRFRVSKKRNKVYRPRDTGHAPGTEISGEDTISTSSDNGKQGIDITPENSGVQTALRLRQARRGGRFRRGVAFRSETHAFGTDDEAQQALVLRDQGASEGENIPVLQGISDRFTHQTGFIAELNDKHMTEYIESRLANRKAAAAAAAAMDETMEDDYTDAAGETALTGLPKKATNHPTQQGKLLEVELPPQTTDTRDYRSREHRENNSKKRRRLGTSIADGKESTPRRHLNRRGSDDIKRDQLVEAFLHENRLEVYDLPAGTSTAGTSAAAAGQSADDRLAEEFRQQYLNEVARRSQRRKPAINQPRSAHIQQKQQQAAAAGDVLKGPKLGGSRNSRAAYRDMLLIQQEREKKGRG